MDKMHNCAVDKSKRDWMKVDPIHTGKKQELK
jgi:hypothetical protein